MSETVEHVWFDWLWKIFSTLFLPLVAWLWQSNRITIEHRLAVKARFEANETEQKQLKEAVGEIKESVGKIMNHITKTNLH